MAKKKIADALGIGADIIDGGEGVTVEEIWLASGGLAISTINKRMRAAIAKGQVEFIGRKSVIRVDGQRSLKPAYRLKT